MQVRDGEWFHFTIKAEHDKMHSGRVQKGDWQGPGWYYKTNYSQRCPRGCCWDEVTKLQTADERVAEITEAIRELAYSLKEARPKTLARIQSLLQRIDNPKYKPTYEEQELISKLLNQKG